MSEVVFAIGVKTINQGSVTLRTFQLEEIVREPCSRIGLHTSVRIGTEHISGAKVIISKSYVTDYGLEGVRRLERDGNELILDPVDWVIDERIVRICHRVLASSYEQLYFLKNLNIPGQKVFLVPHHVDLRIPPIECQRNHFNLGYFGAPKNAKMLRHCLFRSPPCDVVPADSPGNTDWIKWLPRYNGHYLMRRDDHRPLRQFKPFVKGYIAAHCGAVVIASEDDKEAIFHLGADYPFLFRAKTNRDIRLAIAAASASFNDRIWARALEIMDRMKTIFSVDNVRSSMVAAMS